MQRVYELYPKGIAGTDNNYNKTEEFIKLSNELTYKIDKDYSSWQNIIEELKNRKLNIIDKTSFTTNQPSLVFVVVIEKKATLIKSIHFYYSFLIPYFYYAHVIHNMENLATQEISINNPKIFPHIVKGIVSLIKEKFNVALFPNKYLDIKIPDISFEAICQGNFTFRNAFFNKKHLL